MFDDNLEKEVCEAILMDIYYKTQVERKKSCRIDTNICIPDEDSNSNLQEDEED